MKSGLGRVASNIILLLCSLLFILLVLEVYFRLFNPQSLRLSRPDPVLGWNHVANTSGLWRKSCFTSELSFNSEGMRDIEHDLKKPDGTYRIAVIGDSYITAQEVAFDETLFSQLQQILNGRGKKVEVLGFGVRGFGTDQGYLLLENLALKYDPDLVILAFVANDVRNNLLVLEKNPAKPYFELLPDGNLAKQPFTPMPDHSGSWKSQLFKNLHTVRFVYFKAANVKVINNALVKFGIYATFIPEPTGPDDLMGNTVYRNPPWPEDWESSWRVTKRLLQEFQIKSNTHGAKFILFSVTRRAQVEDNQFNKIKERHPNIVISQDNLVKRLAAFTQHEGIAYVPSLSAMRKLQASGTDVHLSCDGHWSRDGHQRGAELLADYIVLEGYI